MKKQYSRNHFNREDYVQRDSRNFNNRTIDPSIGDTYKADFGLPSGVTSPQEKKKFTFRRVGESEEALAAKKAKVQFSKNGLTVVQKTRVLSMSPSRTLMSLNREASYGHLMRMSGNQTLPDGSLSGSNQNS